MNPLREIARHIKIYQNYFNIGTQKNWVKTIQEESKICQNLAPFS